MSESNDCKYGDQDSQLDRLLKDHDQSYWDAPSRPSLQFEIEQSEAQDSYRYWPWKLITIALLLIVLLLTLKPQSNRAAGVKPIESNRRQKQNSQNKLRQWSIFSLIQDDDQVDEPIDERVIKSSHLKHLDANYEDEKQQPGK